MFALRIIDSDYSQFYALKSPRMQVAQRRQCENYTRQVGWDRVLGWSGFVVYLERDKVVNFQRLGQDVAMFGGIIVS